MKLATLCYVRLANHTLMLKRDRQPEDIHYGKWNGLGGKLHEGETPEECVVREVFEESSLNIENVTLKGMITFPKFDGTEDWYVFIFTANPKNHNLDINQSLESNEGSLSWIESDKIVDLNLWEGDYIFLPWIESDNFFSGKFVYQNGKLARHDVVFYPPSVNI